VDVVRNCHPQLLVCTSHVPSAQPAHQGGEEGTATQTQLFDKSRVNIVKSVLRTRKEMPWMVWTPTVDDSHTLMFYPHSFPFGQSRPAESHRQNAGHRVANRTKILVKGMARKSDENVGNNAGAGVLQLEVAHTQDSMFLRE